MNSRLCAAREQRVQHVLEDAGVDGDGTQAPVGGLDVLVPEQDLHHEQWIDLASLAKYSSRAMKDVR